MHRTRHFLLAALIGFASPGVRAAEALPQVLWWYWDRPAAQLPPPAPGIGAAVVVAHVLLSGEAAIRQRRRSALPLPDTVAILPVIHVEIDPGRPFAGTPAQLAALRAAVTEAATHGAADWVQLDFEARESQRDFWRASVDAIKAALPRHTRLSVTALASWCHGDRWLAGAPVDEVVPMYFRLGRARQQYITRSAAGVSEPLCAHAHGVADDEPDWPATLPGRRYVFLGHRTRHPLTHRTGPAP